MARKKQVEESGSGVTDEMRTLVAEIGDLVKVRAALSFGTRTGEKDKAESAMSRAINSKVIQLSKLVSKKFD
jgi:hypothetical protein